MKNTDTALTDPIQVAFRNLGLNNTRGYGEIASGELETYKVGRNRFATKAAQRRYLERKERASRPRKRRAV